MRRIICWRVSGERTFVTTLCIWRADRRVVLLKLSKQALINEIGKENRSQIFLHLIGCVKNSRFLPRALGNYWRCFNEWDQEGYQCAENHRISKTHCVLGNKCNSVIWGNHVGKWKTFTKWSICSSLPFSLPSKAHSTQNTKAALSLLLLPVAIPLLL